VIVPQLVWDKIFDYLPLPSQIHLSMVNWHFRELVISYVQSRGIVIDSNTFKVPAVKKSQITKEQWLHILLSNSLLQSKHVREMDLIDIRNWTPDLKWDELLTRMSKYGYLTKLKTLSLFYDDLHNKMDNGLLKKMMPFITSLVSLRVGTETWFDVKEEVMELVNRASFNRLELMIALDVNCDDLLYTIEKHPNLKLKLKGLVQDYDIYCPNSLNIHHWPKTDRPPLISRDEFFPRMLNVAQNFEEFELHLWKLSNNHDHAVISQIENFVPKKLIKLTLIIHPDFGYLSLLSRCGANLKLLRISGAETFAVDKILALCPRLIDLRLVESGDFIVCSSSVNDEPTNWEHPLRFLMCRIKPSDAKSVKNWLAKQCPSVSRKSPIFIY